MDETEAKTLAATIMREQNVDNLQGFGEINMRRLEGMLVDAAKAGFRAGWSQGWREADQAGRSLTDE